MTDNTNTAATSGDAPADLQQIKALALAFQNENGEHWYNYLQLADGISYESAADFMVKVSPAVVLGLIARIEHLTTVPEQAPSTEQEWAKVDPAVAFHLIERHAEDWADAGRMMEAWRAATVHIERSAAPATASGDELPPLPEPVRFAQWTGGVELAYTEDQMRAYARAAVSAATKPTADLSADHDEFWKHVIAYCKGTGNEGQALVDYVNGWVQSLLATKPAVAPEGWKLVPVDPSIAMCIHGADKMSGNDGREAAAVYRAMIHATPAASTTGAAQTAEQVACKNEKCEGGRHYNTEHTRSWPCPDCSTHTPTVGGQ